MGGCRNRSETIPFVLRRPRVIGAAVIDPIPPVIGLSIEFDMPMNQALTPGNATMEVVNQGVPYLGTFIGWIDSTHADFDFTIAAPLVGATIAQIITDPQVRSTEGGYGVPDDPVQFVP